MGILDIFKKEEKKRSGIPFRIKASFHPLRLASRKEESVSLLVELENISGDATLTSLVIDVPKQLGFDSVGLHKRKELRLGILQKDEKKELRVEIWGNTMTPPGEYKIPLTAYAHYRDYGHILNSVSKVLELRVV